MAYIKKQEMKILLSTLQLKRANLKQAEQASITKDNENNETLKNLMAPESGVTP